MDIFFINLICCSFYVVINNNSFTFRQQVTLIAYHQLENDTLSAELSHKSDSTIHIVEQLAGHKVGCDNLNIALCTKHYYISLCRCGILTQFC